MSGVAAIVEALLVALAPSIAKVVENAASPNYDKKAELDALVQMQDAIAAERAKHIISGS